MVLELESKSTMVTCDLYIAHTDGSLRKEQPDMNNVFDDSRIKSLRLINALSYALTTIVVLSSIHTSSNNQYDDYEVWMANQTLLSVAPHTQYIWYPLFILQGLFIAASYLPSLWSSELLGYTALAAETGYKKSLPVVHYSALCASTLMMMYSVKLNIMSLAFAGSCVSTYFLAHIIKYQLDTGTTPTDENADGILGSRKQIQQYVFLKLPFELYAGYNFALNVAFLNIIMHKLFGSVVFNVMLSSVSLVVMLVVGCYVTWMEKNWWCCGIGGGMAWYLFGVFFQLIYPSSPIEMTYSEGAIAATKYMTAIFANILLSTVALRAVKNAINVRVCCGYEDEDEDEVADGQLDEDEAVTGYAQV